MGRVLEKSFVKSLVKSCFLSVATGDGILGLAALEKESLLTGILDELAIVDIVFPGIVLLKLLGLKPVTGGLTKPGCFSLSCLFKYVIKFSLDLRDSWASYNFVFKV